MTHQLWGGRFGAAPADSLNKLNRSLPVDYRLWPQDIRAAKAWVDVLHAAGVLSQDERNSLEEGLDMVVRRLSEGEGCDGSDEDIHTLVERFLYEEAGPVAGKLNTGRSRNDQVVTDLRLWILEAMGLIDRGIRSLGRALLGQADIGTDILLPGYTHGQRAQPVRWSYVMLAHAWPLVRDRQRLADARRRISELPLGSGAVAGSGIQVDRERLRVALGFDRLSPNALDATGDRDFVAETLFALTLLAAHLSRLAGELMMYSSSEFGFVRIADEYCTGSSLLPQKRNPDVLELARGKASRVLADMVGLMGVIKGLPAGYSKDLQEDKSFLFDAVDTVLLTLPALAGAVDSMLPRGERMAQALDEGMFATDLADGLVRSGVPFRDAHKMVGRLVRVAENRAVGLRSIAPSDAEGIHHALPGLVQGLGGFEESVERRPTSGGSSRAAVAAQVEELRREFGEGP